jgi:micrococcal nuclease
MNIIRRLCTRTTYNHLDVDYLDNVDYHDTVHYVPQLTCGKVVKVYDGDTITIASRLPGNDTIYRFSIRLAGIDTPEIKTVNKMEKERAVFVRDKLYDLIFGKIVMLKNISIEKYGRILADIYLDVLHVNEYMIQHNYAYKYNGGKKQHFNEITT